MRNFNLKSWMTLLAVCAFSVSAFSQLVLPQKSPKSSVSYTVGLTEITINYSSPSVNEREIWGALLPYDKMWRAGANEATTIEFSSDVVLEGQKLAAGRYAFFLIPRAEGKWTAVFNSVADQWGAYKYDESKDALRVDITPKMKGQSIDRLNYAIVDQGFDKGYIRLSWEKARIYLRFRTEYLDQAISNVEAALADTSLADRQWVVYAQGADFLLGTEKKNELALEWANKSTELFNHGWNWWIKAQAQAANGDYKSALASIEKCKELDTASDDDSFYTDAKAEVDKMQAEWSQKS